MINLRVQQSCISLFNVICYPEVMEKRMVEPREIYMVQSQYLLRGIYLDPTAANVFCKASINDRRHIDGALLDYAVNIKDIVNGPLVESFKEAKDISDIDLFVKQTIEYISSYEGGKWLYDSRTKILSREYGKSIKMDILSITANSVDEIKSRVYNMLYSNIAYNICTIEHLANLIQDLKIPFEMDKVRNKELRCKLWAFMDEVPENPIDVLRLLVFLRTEETMLIKSKTLIDSIKERALMVEERITMKKYITKYGYEPLGSIFYRYKHIWLALRHYNKSSADREACEEYVSIINKIRRVARKVHKPMKTKIMDRVFTTPFGRDFMAEWEQELEKTSTYKLISIYNSALTRSLKHEFDIYRIRNNKVYIKECDRRPYPNTVEIDPEWFMVYLKNIIENRISNNIKKVYKRKIKVFFKDGINVALPTSEKAYWGNVPFGTSFVTDKNIVVGIHWYDVDNKRIDLDLRYTDIRGDIGWNTYIGERQPNVIFTGDVVKAPVNSGGATEAFYIGKDRKSSGIFRVYFYNHSQYMGDVKPKYRLFISSLKEDLDNPRSDTSLENIIKSGNSPFVSVNNQFDDNTEFIVGYVKTNENDKKEFVIQNLGFGYRSVGDDGYKTKMFLKAIDSSKCLMVKDIAKHIGYMEIVDNPDEADINFADLSTMAKDTFIKLIG